jgi:hypothetical protein
MIKKILTSIPIDFNKQDEGHANQNPSIWKIMTTYYQGVYPYKWFNNKKILTGSFQDVIVDEKDIIDIYFINKKKYTSSVKNLK